MSPANIRTRISKLTGKKTYEVWYRRGGRAFRQESCGTFKSKKEAQIRRDLVAGFLAAGQDPKLELAKAVAQPSGGRLTGWFDRFITSRVDVAPKTAALYRNARDRVTKTLGDTPVGALTVADIQAWVLSCDDLSPNTVKQYLGTLRQVLDFADVEPNPARSRKVRVPSAVREEPQPPTSREWQLIIQNARKNYRLILRLIECLGLRAAEALSLTYGDIDFNASRIRVSKARTKGRTAGQRWLPVPAELLDQMADLVPLEDRHRDRQVFPDLNYPNVRWALGIACRDAEVAHYTLHMLRHRRISLWFAHRIDLITIKTWSGHTKASMSSDVYGHVVVEPHLDEWRAHWLSAYVEERQEIGITIVPASGPVGGDE